MTSLGVTLPSTAGPITTPIINSPIMVGRPFFSSLQQLPKPQALTLIMNERLIP